MITNNTLKNIMSKHIEENSKAIRKEEEERKRIEKEKELKNIKLKEKYQEFLKSHYYDNFKKYFNYCLETTSKFKTIYDHNFEYNYITMSVILFNIKKDYDEDNIFFENNYINVALSGDYNYKGLVLFGQFNNEHVIDAIRNIFDSDIKLTITKNNEFDKLKSLSSSNLNQLSKMGLSGSFCLPIKPYVGISNFDENNYHLTSFPFLDKKTYGEFVSIRHISGLSFDTNHETFDYIPYIYKYDIEIELK